MMQLRETLLHYGGSLWRRCGRILDMLRLTGAQKERNAAAGHAEARARFWDGVSEGRREAAARCSEQNQ